MTTKATTKAAKPSKTAGIIASKLAKKAAKMNAPEAPPPMKKAKAINSTPPALAKAPPAEAAKKPKQPAAPAASDGAAPPAALVALKATATTKGLPLTIQKNGDTWFIGVADRVGRGKFMPQSNTTFIARDGKDFKDGPFALPGAADTIVTMLTASAKLAGGEIAAFLAGVGKGNTDNVTRLTEPGVLGDTLGDVWIDFDLGGGQHYRLTWHQDTYNLWLAQYAGDPKTDAEWEKAKLEGWRCKARGIDSISQGLRVMADYYDAAMG